MPFLYGHGLPEMRASRPAGIGYAGHVCGFLLVFFWRYPDNRNAEKAFDSALINRLLPVDMYVGGAEHAAMHLLYARFITKVLHDMGH